MNQTIEERLSGMLDWLDAMSMARKGALAQILELEGRAARRVLTVVAKSLPKRVIGNPGSDYLHRFYVCGRRSPQQDWPKDMKPVLGWLPFTVFLHRFMRADAEREHHNHPWSWAMSMILAGGYVEERVDGRGKISVRDRTAGSINMIWRDTFHRASSLIEEDAWTLFVVGRRIDSWGFRLEDGTFMHWREFVEGATPKPTEPWLTNERMQEIADYAAEFKRPADRLEDFLGVGLALVMYRSA